MHLNGELLGTLCEKRHDAAALMDNKHFITLGVHIAIIALVSMHITIIMLVSVHIMIITLVSVHIAIIALVSVHITITTR